MGVKAALTSSDALHNEPGIFVHKNAQDKPP
jgi:hypothetical protein